MADTKTSELPANTTPDSTALIPVVESNTTSKSTVSQVVGAVLGWFDVGHNGSSQTSIGTSETQVLVDAAGTNQGGYDYLPNGISSSQVYDSSTSKIKLGWLSQGQSASLTSFGSLTTSTTTTVVTITHKFYDSSDVLVRTLSDEREYSVAGTYAFSFTTPVWVSSDLASDGYCKVYMTFDGGAGNAIDMGGFNLSVTS